jgi:hypothetical protein
MKTALALFSLLAAALPAAAHLDALTSPKAGETYAPGTVINVKWGVPIVHNAQDLAYSTDGKTWISIVKGLAPATKAYAWTVPQLNSTTVRLRVCQLDGGAKECTDAHQTQSLDGFAIPGGKLYIAIAGNFTVRPATAVRPVLRQRDSRTSGLDRQEFDLRGRRLAPFYLRPTP